MKKLRFPRLESCCCAYSLERGAEIVGSLEMILHIGLVFLSVSVVFSVRDTTTYPNLTEGEVRTLYVMFVIMSVMTAGQLLVSLLLVYGASSRKSHLILPWMIYAPLTFLVSLTVMISTMVIFSIGKMGGALAASIVGFVAIMVLKFYSVVVVNSYYRSLARTNRLIVTQQGDI